MALPTTTALNFAPIVNGASVINSPSYAYQYLNAKRQNIIDGALQRPLVRLWDENHEYIGVINNELSGEHSENYMDAGGAAIKINQSNWLSQFIMYDRRAEQDLHITFDNDPLNRSWETRWGGKVTNVAAKRDRQGLHTIELNAVHNLEHNKHIVAAANPVFPPELQIPKMWILPWNMRTVFFISMFVNLARQFEPFLAIPDNIANPTMWLGEASNPFNVNPMNWPIQPQFINPFTDTSRFEVFSSRWQDMHSSTAVIMEDAGCIPRAYTYIVGEDTTSPHPELAGIGSALPGIWGDFIGDLTEQAFMPTRSCVVLGIDDKSGIVGWTGTMADGPLDAIVATADDLVTDVVIPQYATDGQAYTLDSNGEGGLTTLTPDQIATFMGLNPQPPWVVFRDGEYSGIFESAHTVHGATAKTIHVGGKSPGYVNDLLTFGIKWGLSQLQTVITAGFGGEAGGPPIGAGLDELYQGELDDTILAYESYSDPDRELWTGDMGFLEDFQQGTGTAYTISGVLALRAGDWKTRAYDSYNTTLRNAAPYVYNLDFGIGDRVGFQSGQVIYCDQVSMAKCSWDLSKPLEWEFTVGTKANEEDPVSKAMRAIAGVWNLFGMFAGGSGTFG